MNKQLLFLSIVLFFTIKINAQIGISATNTPPNASAMLDVSSTTKGLLPPRMTSLQRTNITSPADGLLVFDADTQSYWFRQSGAWTELPKGGSTNNYWQLNGSAGNEIKNTNSGGLWSANSIGLSSGSDDTSNPPTAPVNGAGTRMMWIPSRSAFRVGTINSTLGNQTNWDASNIGMSSFASGWNNKAQGFGATAMGGYTNASGIFSTALGVGTTASGLHATALGWSTTASGEKSTAMGVYGSTNGRTGSFIIHDNINENVFGITQNNLDNQMIMKFDGGFGFYSGGATDASMGFEKTIGLSVYGKGIRAYGGGNIYTENGGKMGVNTASPNSTFEVNGSQSMPFVFAGTDYSATAQDYTIIANLQSDVNKVININLPSPVLSRGRIYQIRLIQSPGASTRNCIFDREKFGPVFNQVPVTGTDKGYVAIKDYNGDLITCLYEFAAQRCGGGGAILNPIGAFESVLGFLSGNPVTNCAYYSASRTCVTIQSIGTRWIVIAENLAIDQYKW